MPAVANRPTVRVLFGGALALALLAALLYQRHSEQQAQRAGDRPAAAEPAAGGPAASAQAPQPAQKKELPGGVTVQVGEPSAAGAPAADDPAARAERLRLAQERLANFRAWAQYPPGSRPARENPDQLRPTDPVVRKLPMSLSGLPSQNVGLKLRQDRLTVVGAEVIQLGIRCEDTLGHALPCSVDSAQVSPLPLDNGGATALPKQPVRFTTDPTPGHEGELVASLRPLELKLVDRTWPLRVDVTLRAGNDPVEQGAALFDFLFTPEPPAVTTGKIREAVVDGSLVLYYGLNVRKAGRYVLHVRVDDAVGNPVALLEWNDPLATGPQEVKLVVFGKLLHDEHPRMPLKLRDFDGFLLKEQADPDRESLATWSGYHHTTQTYALSVFSAQKWQSEDSARHEREFESDVENASR